MQQPDSVQNKVLAISVVSFVTVLVVYNIAVPLLFGVRPGDPRVFKAEVIAMLFPLLSANGQLAVRALDEPLKPLLFKAFAIALLLSFVAPLLWTVL